MPLKPGTLCYFIDCGPALDGRLTTVQKGPDPCVNCKIDTYQVEVPPGVLPEFILALMMAITGNLWVHRHQLIPINTPDQDVDVKHDEEVTA